MAVFSLTAFDIGACVHSATLFKPIYATHIGLRAVTLRLERIALGGHLQDFDAVQTNVAGIVGLGRVIARLARKAGLTSLLEIL